jgi:hypothetical protein
MMEWKSERKCEHSSGSRTLRARCTFFTLLCRWLGKPNRESEQELQWS